MHCRSFCLSAGDADHWQYSSWPAPRSAASAMLAMPQWAAADQTPGMAFFPAGRIVDRRVLPNVASGRHRVQCSACWAHCFRARKSAQRVPSAGRAETHQDYLTGIPLQTGVIFGDLARVSWRGSNAAMPALRRCGDSTSIISGRSPDQHGQRGVCRRQCWRSGRAAIAARDARGPMSSPVAGGEGICWVMALSPIGS